MAQSPPIVFSIFLFILLLLANAMGPAMVEGARNCETRSQRFKGLCMSNPNCASVCNSEHFPGGHCRGLKRRCYCTKNCPVEVENGGSTASS